MSRHHDNKQITITLPQAAALACLRRGGYQLVCEAGLPTSIHSSWTFGNPEDGT